MKYNFWYLLLVGLLIILLFIFYSKIIEGYSSNIEMYVISLKHEDRLKNIKSQEDKIGEKIQIFDAVKGDQLNIEQLLRDKLIDNKYSTNDKVKKREVGCYMSHLNMIKQINNSKTSGYTIIFEDDFDIIDDTFMKSVSKIIKKLDENKIEFDIVFLGNLKENHGERIIENENIYKIDQNENLWGTHGYLINNSKINKIIDKIKFIDMAIDIKYESLGKSGELIIYVIYPTIVNQQGDKLSSTINDLSIENFYLN
jgi:GR25 family glycosyltransferase involved in LPS biosynthesis